MNIQVNDVGTAPADTIHMERGAIMSELDEWETWAIVQREKQKYNERIQRNRGYVVAVALLIGLPIAYVVILWFGR